MLLTQWALCEFQVSVIVALIYCRKVKKFFQQEIKVIDTVMFVV